jgi:hypothetical protein
MYGPPAAGISVGSGEAQAEARARTTMLPTFDRAVRHCRLPGWELLALPLPLDRERAASGASAAVPGAPPGCARRHPVRVGPGAVSDQRRVTDPLSFGQLSRRRKSAVVQHARSGMPRAGPGSHLFFSISAAPERRPEQKRDEGQEGAKAKHDPDRAQDAGDARRKPKEHAVSRPARQHLAIVARDELRREVGEPFLVRQRHRGNSPSG